jgi:hypothetical protein
MGNRIFLIICLLFLLILLNGYSYQTPAFTSGTSNIFLLGVCLMILGELNKKITHN